MPAALCYTPNQQVLVDIPQLFQHGIRLLIGEEVGNEG